MGSTGVPFSHPPPPLQHRVLCVVPLPYSNHTVFQSKDYQGNIFRELISQYYHLWIPKRIPYCRLSMVKSVSMGIEIINKPAHQNNKQQFICE
jgi:hypothetical protein